MDLKTTSKTYPANWTAPPNISAFTTTSLGGVSVSPYSSNNLAYHVGDEKEHVKENRARLVLQHHLPEEPFWLNQTHSAICVNIDNSDNENADASITQTHGKVLAILTADCLPILICHKDGKQVAAIHAGWRGLQRKIIEETTKQLIDSPANYLAWIGPGICPQCYEVDDTLLKAFQESHPFLDGTFLPSRNKWKANLPKIAEQILNKAGISHIFMSKLCTFEEEKTLFSYRRKPETGRMASLIWINRN